MIINHNISALNTYNKLSANNATGSKALEKLSSGLRINRAGDDAAGLAISEKMRGQIRGLDQATRNGQDGISLIQTAEGALNETHSILQRMRELAVQAASDTNTDGDRAEIQKEVEQLKSEVTRISTDTEFNTKKLLNGGMGKAIASYGTNTLSPASMQVVGASVTTGAYTLTATAGGTDTVAFLGQTAAPTLTAADIATAGASDYGHYTVNVTNYNGVAHTADFQLIKPDGSQVVASGLSTNSAAQTVGNITFDFSTRNVSANGSIDWNLTSNGMNLTLSGAGAGSTGAMAAYNGAQLNVGGFQFKMQTGHGATATSTVMNVVDNSVKFHIGANAGQNVTLAINSMSSTALNIGSIDLSTQTGANNAITTIETALETVSSERAKLGAMQNRLEHTINNLTTSSENLSASESRVRDVDMAKEMMNFTKTNILSQAATAMLAQANQAPQGVLQLLK